MVSAPWEFRILRILSSVRLLTLGPSIDVEPAAGAPQLITTVVRLPEPLAQAIHDHLRTLFRHHPEHHIYPVSTIHISISGFTVRADFDLLIIENAVEEALSHTSPFSIELLGLSLSPSTVLIQALPHDDAIAGIRQRISFVLQDKEPHLRPRSRPFPSQHIAFANVLRFLGPIDAPTLLRDVKRLKDHEFGRFKVQEIQLVRTDKFLSDQGTEILRPFSLV